MAKVTSANNSASQQFPVGTRVSVYWEPDGASYEAVVIDAPEGEKRSSSLRNKVYVEFTKGGEWDLVSTEHVTLIKPAPKRVRREEPKNDPVEAPVGTIERITNSWRADPSDHSTMVYDLLRLAYLTEGHGKNILSLILSDPMDIRISQPYIVARENANPQWLVSDVLGCLNGSIEPAQSKAFAPIPETPIRPKRVMYIGSDSSEEESSDLDLYDSSSDSEGSKSRYGPPTDTAMRIAVVLTTPVQSSIQLKRARDAYSEVAMSTVAHDISIITSHYAWLLIRAQTNSYGAEYKTRAGLADTLRNWEKDGHTVWKADNLPSKGVIAAISDIINGDPEDVYVLKHAVEDITDTLRHDMSPALWGLLTSVEFKVRRVIVPAVHNRKCDACNQTRALTSKFYWNFRNIEESWMVGSDCADRILVARKAHDFIDLCADKDGDGPNEDVLLKEWASIYSDIERVTCARPVAE